MERSIYNALFGAQSTDGRRLYASRQVCKLGVVILIRIIGLWVSGQSRRAVHLSTGSPISMLPTLASVSPPGLAPAWQATRR